MERAPSNESSTNEASAWTTLSMIWRPRIRIASGEQHLRRRRPAIAPPRGPPWDEQGCVERRRRGDAGDDGDVARCWSLLAPRIPSGPGAEFGALHDLGEGLLVQRADIPPHLCWLRLESPSNSRTRVGLIFAVCRALARASPASRNSQLCPFPGFRLPGPRCRRQLRSEPPAPGAGFGAGQDQGRHYLRGSKGSVRIRGKHDIEQQLLLCADHTKSLPARLQPLGDIAPTILEDTGRLISQTQAWDEAPRPGPEEEEEAYEPRDEDARAVPPLPMIGGEQHPEARAQCNLVVGIDDSQIDDEMLGRPTSAPTARTMFDVDAGTAAQ